MDKTLYRYEIVKGSYATGAQDETEIVEIDSNDLLYQFECDNGKIDSINIDNIQSCITEIRLYGYREIIKESKLIEDLSIDNSERTICFGMEDKFDNLRIEIYMELNIDDDCKESCFVRCTNFNF